MEITQAMIDNATRKLEFNGFPVQALKLADQLTNGLHKHVEGSLRDQSGKNEVWVRVTWEDEEPGFYASLLDREGEPLNETSTGYDHEAIGEAIINAFDNAEG